jgi:hypothetical protein
MTCWCSWDRKSNPSLGEQYDPKILNSVWLDRKLLPHNLGPDRKLLPHTLGPDRKLLPHTLGPDRKLLPHTDSAIKTETSEQKSVSNIFFLLR